MLVLRCAFANVMKLKIEDIFTKGLLFFYFKTWLPCSYAVSTVTALLLVQPERDKGEDMKAQVES